ncbi:MAG: polysaccharide biosynthesis/export family protein [Planctomycetes bacterium]|nr:polysaccharide biosynthesis/export family protein [Planctomycetota bacterium]MBI3845838.1 polysaccharide biosynthesis/export family protein [Planctomycetota bacterium]
MWDKSLTAAFLGAALGFSASFFFGGDGGDPRSSTTPDSTGSEYLLTTGDQIEIRIYQQDSLNQIVNVPTNGAISFAPVGTLKLAGRTTADIERELAASLEKSGFLVQPQVSVVVKDYAKRWVYLLEGVAHPQAYELTVGQDLRLTQVLSLGGGLVDDAEREMVQIFRKKPGGGLPDLISINLTEIIEGGKIENDILIRPDDTIVIRNLKVDESKIFVMGKVKSPGSFPWKKKDNLTVFRSIALAGGFDKYAKPEGTVVLRRTPKGDEVHKVNLIEVIEGGLKSDLKLEPNDVVFVPESFL